MNDGAGLGLAAVYKLLIQTLLPEDVFAVYVVPEYVPTEIIVVYVPGIVSDVPHPLATDVALDDGAGVGEGVADGFGVDGPGVTKVTAVVVTAVAGMPGTCAPKVIT